MVPQMQVNLDLFENFFLLFLSLPSILRIALVDSSNLVQRRWLRFPLHKQLLWLLVQWFSNNVRKMIGN